MRKAIKIVLSIVAAFLLSYSFAHAGAEHNISGWAWSGNIGWISFNCTNEDTCDTSNYGVTMEPDGDLVGYAWSSTIGWIQFGGLSGFPSGTGTQSINAKVNGNNLQGWARALSHGSGWDGWISLSGATPNYGVDLDGANFEGYAWGDDVVGWVLFDVHTVYPSVCSDCGVKMSGSASLDVKSGGISIVDNTSVPYGTIPTFEWTLTDLPAGTTCSVSKTSSGGMAFTPVTGITTSGSVVGDALTNASYTYEMECENGGAVLASDEVSFTVLEEPPGFSLGGIESARIQFVGNGSADSETLNIFVNPNSSFLSAGNPVSISITGFPTMPATTTYSFDGGQSFLPDPGTIVIPSPYTTGVPFKVRVELPITTTYQVTITGSASGVSDVTKTILIDPTQFEPLFDEH